MDKKWFDPETNVLLFDEYVMDIPTYQKIMADGQVTTEELAEQSKKVVDILKRLDEKLDGEEREMVTELLCELSVLHAVTQVSLSELL